MKVPVGGKRLLLSTGRTDYGVQASVQRFGNHHAIYVDLATVYYDGAAEPLRPETRMADVAEWIEQARSALLGIQRAFS